MTMNVFCLSAIADSSALNVQHYKGKADFYNILIMFTWVFSSILFQKFAIVKEGLLQIMESRPELK
jgi:hypothetical protein